MKANEKDKPERLPSVSGPGTGPSNLSAPPEVEGYEILRILGEGGMGVVYLARQQVPVQRQVALKIVKPGMDSKQVIARFEAEEQALALLDHPNIAQVYDAGTTKDGHPYFSMEYVIGQPITEYCDKHKLSIEERLELFIHVCEGVQHAHQKGIIHRDIKPSNVLVYSEDNKPLPKIIDFGVAKALTAPLTEQTLFTEQGQLLGTPEYMSPEQAEMTRHDIDTRSDIYSLGVLLYVLLTGALPFDRKTLERAGFAEILRTIREQEPPRPSTRLSSLGLEAKNAAASRRTHVGALTKQLHKELEWIPLKAMRKERWRRYESAAQFARDIQNYLKGEPLIAGPESRIYRSRKFVRRNRVVVAAVSAILIVLIGAAVISTVFAVGQARERIRAERQSKVTQAVVDFLNNDVLASVDPVRARGRQVTVSEVLDAASRKIEGRFKDEPLIEAAVRLTLGKTYLKLGEYAEAARHLERVRQLHRKHLHEDDLVVLQSVRELGWVYTCQGQYEKAEALLPKTVEIMKRVLGDEHPETLFTMNNLAVLYKEEGRCKQAEDLYLEILAISPRVLGREHLGTLNPMHNLATLYSEQGRYQAAESLYLKVLEAKKRRFGEDHPDTLRTMNNLALVYNKQGRYQQAEELYLRTARIMKRVLGEEHPDTMNPMHNLAILYRDQGRGQEEEELYNKILEIRGRVLGEEHPDTLRTMNDLAVLYLKQGRYVEAESLCLRTVETKERVLGEEHPDTLGSMSNLAHVYYHQGRYEEAEALYLKTVEAWERVLGKDHPETVKTINLLVVLYKAWGKPDEAQKWRASLSESEAEGAKVEVSQYVIAEKNLKIPEPLQTCSANLEKVYAAINKYGKDKGKLPDRLSDLVPEYLGEETLLCPSDPTYKAQSSPDPKLPCSYSWELSSDQIPVGWNPTGRMLYRDWKTQQAKLFGNVVPIVRCHHHGDQKVLNLSMGGQIYWGQLDWEYMFKPDYRFGDERSRPEPNDAHQTIPLPATIRELLGTMTEADIVREAVARQFGKKPQELTDEDYKKVEQLNLSRLEISELEPLEALTGLKKLHLYDTQVSELEPLKTLTSLRELRLSRTRIRNLEPLAGLTNLQKLWVDGTQVSDLEPLKGLTGLEVLDLGYTRVTSLDPLVALPNLKKLWLPATPLSSLESLKELGNLQELHLWDTGVSDLEPLRRLTSLQRLYLGGTHITDPGPLVGLTKLQVLCLANTQVKDLSPLKALVSLQEIHLCSTNVSDAQVTELQKALPKVSIYGKQAKCP